MLFNIFRIGKKLGKAPSHVNFRKDNDVKLLSPISLQVGNDTFTAEAIRCQANDTLFYKTIINNKNHDEIGNHYYMMNKPAAFMFGTYLDTFPKYRGRGIGEILRLINIIEMVENKIKNNNIVSLPSAVAFHIKYKFLPNIMDLGSSFLQDISTSKYSTPAMKEIAEKLLYQSKTDKGTDAEYLRVINNLVYEYIEKNHSNWDKAKFRENVPMKLTLKTIKDNADFYNKLFTKHGIDYRI